MIDTMLLLICDILENIQCAQSILDFTILIQYVSHDDKMLQYIKHALYRLK